MTTTQLITIPWNIIAVCALYAHLWAANDARRDLLVLREAALDGPMRFIARFNMFVSLGLAVAQSCFLITGVASFFGTAPAARVAGVCLDYLVDNGFDLPSTFCLGLAEAITRPAFTLQATAILVTIVGAEFVLMGVSFFIVWGRRRTRALLLADRAQRVHATA